MVEIKSYKPFEKQKEFHRSKAKYPCAMGGFGSGKTTELVWEAIDLSLKYPENVGLIGRKTYRELEDTTKQSFLDECPREFIANIIKSENKVIFVNGSVLLFRSLEEYDKIKSLNLGFFGIDQGEEISKNYFMLLQGRLRLMKVPERKGFVVANPPSVTHWIHELWVEKQDPRYELIKTTSYDNPYLPKDYIDDLVKDYPENWVRRYIFGDFGFISEGYPVYTAFKRSLHSVDFNFIPQKTVYRGWDFGWAHPCVVFAQFDEKDRLVWYRTSLGTRVFLTQFADYIIKSSNQWFPNCSFEDFCDPAGKQKTDKTKETSIQILESKGIRPSHRTKSNIMKGVETIQKKLLTLMGDKPSILVHKGNQLAIDMLEGGYYFGKDLEGNVSKDEPYKDGYFEHIADGVRYIVENLFSHEPMVQRSNITIKQPAWRSGIGHTGANYGR